MAAPIDHYRVEVDVARDRGPRSMQWFVDVICEALERECNCTDRDYYVEVHGPPELRIGVVMK
jgi:hypothetical protein